MKTTIWRPAPTRKRTLRRIATAGAVAATLLLGTVAAAATTPTGTQDQTDQATTPSQSEQERTQARHRALGALDTPAAQPAGGEPERTLARHRALGTLDTLAAPAAIAAQPAAKTDPAAPSPGVNLVATLLVGLVGGLVGGAAAVVGWTAMTRRRRPPAAGTLTVIAIAVAVAATLLLGAAPPAAAASSDSPACTDCAALFDTLRADVAAYVPTTQQPVFLTNIDQASLAAGVVETFPPDPIQPDVVAASVILDRLTADTSDLQAAAVVSDGGLATITTDINRLEAEFFTPIDPCQVASFDSLRADVAAYVPTTQQPVFLSAVDAAEPQAAADVVAASVILDRLTADASDLQVAGQISEDGLSAIVTDINSLESEFFLPTDPC